MAIDKSIRQHYQGGKKGDPFYKDGEFQTFQQPTRNWDRSDYKYEGPTQSGYTTLGYNESGNPLQDFRGNVRSASGVKQLYQKPRTIADQNRVLGRTSASDSFMKGFQTIAGKGADKIGKATDVASKFAPTDTKTGTFDLQSMVKSQAKSAIKSKIQSAVLGKLGLGSLFPYIGIASWIAEKLGYKPSDLMQGFAPGLKPGQTQAAWEANQEAEALGRRKDYMWDRMLEDKPYSEKNLINVINKIAKTTPYRHEMEMDLSPERKDFGFEDAKAAAQQAAAQQAAAKQAAAKAAAKQAVDRHRGNGGNGGGGYGGGPPGGEGGWKGAKGGYVDRPLPGRNRYL